MDKYIVTIVSCLLISANCLFAQINKIPNATPSKVNKHKQISPSVNIPRDSAVILLNNKFYRLSELNEYNYTVDGISIQSLDVVRDKDVITK